MTNLENNTTSILFYERDKNRKKVKHVLLVRQGNLYSDFGGQRKITTDRNFYDTAFREFLYESFGWKVIPFRLIDDLVSDLINEVGNFQIQVKNNVHVLLILTFKHLEFIIRACRNTERISPYYKVFPTTLYDFFTQRKSNAPKLRLHELDKPYQNIDPRAYEDIVRLQTILKHREFQTRTIGF